MRADQREALMTLLLLPDDDGCTRRSVVTQPGDPRKAARLLRFQPAVYASHQIVARENERLA